VQAISQPSLEVYDVIGLPQTDDLKMVCTISHACKNQQNALKSMFF
jgi:hypothetical protein